jgi:uncharacterized protein YcbX
VSATVQSLYRYPVKGLSPEPMDSVTLTAGLGVPLDRQFALARPSTRFDPEKPEWLNKRSYLMLMVNGRLAALETRYDDAAGTLAILRDGQQVVRGDLHSEAGRATLEDFFSAYLGEEAGGKPRLLDAPKQFMFSDHKSNVVSIINLASVRELERATHAPVDPLRFRANVYVDGLEPWVEFGWMGREIALGAARLTVEDRIVRCAATNVEPGTGKRDMNIPKTLNEAFGHVDMGIYAAVTAGGTARKGDRLAPV